LDAEKAQEAQDALESKRYSALSVIPDDQLANANLSDADKAILQKYNETKFNSYMTNKTNQNKLNNINGDVSETNVTDPMSIIKDMLTQTTEVPNLMEQRAQIKADSGLDDKATAANEAKAEYQKVLDQMNQIDKDVEKRFEGT
jgi:hypothetical protein